MSIHPLTSKRSNEYLILIIYRRDVVSAELTLMQYKHVLVASRGKGHHKSGHKAIYFTNLILGSNTHQKSPKCRINQIFK